MSQLENLMKLGMTKEEAEKVLEDDNRIDHNEKLFELTADQQKNAKKARAIDNKPREKQNRKTKIDNDKKEIIEKLVSIFNSSVEVVNPQREITFIFNNRKFKIVLSEPRK